MGLFLIASLRCGLSGEILVLIGSRIVQAIGAALPPLVSLSIMLAAFPIERRAVVVSLRGVIGGLAAALDPSAGSCLIEQLGRQLAFFVKFPLGAISLVRYARGFTQSREAENGAPLDWVGALAVGADPVASPGLDFAEPSGNFGVAVFALGLPGRARSLGHRSQDLR